MESRPGLGPGLMRADQGSAAEGFAPLVARRRRTLARASLLAVAPLGLVLMLGAPGTALAQCAVTAAPNSVTCATSTTTADTTNTNAGTASSSDRQQLFNAGGIVTVTIDPSVVIDGNGLAITNSQAATTTNGDVTFNNAGTITVSAGATPTQGGTSALNVTATGSITFAGPGTINDGGQGLTAASFSSTSGNIIVGGNGTAANVLGDISGAIGINASLVNGGVLTIAGTGNVTGTAGAGIVVDGGLAGTVTVGGTAANTAIGNVQGATNGITATVFAGSITIENTGTITGTSGNGIDATFGNTGGGTITIAGTGAISGGANGIEANVALGGSVTVGGTTAATRITSVTGGVTGIDVGTSIGSGAVLIAGIGSITGGNAAGQFGIDVTLANSTGIVIGANGVSAAGLVGNVSGGTGINVAISHTGNGSITVAGVGNVTGAVGAGIALDSGLGGAITVGGTAPNTAVGNVLGATDGITASVLGGSITVEGVGTITGTAGNGITAGFAPGGGGTITIAGTGAISGGANGIEANVGLGGSVTVGGTTTAQQISSVTGGVTGIDVGTSIGSGAVLIAGIGSITGGNAAGQFGIDVTLNAVSGIVIGANGVSAAGLVGNVSGGTGINVSLVGTGVITVAGVGNVTGAAGPAIALRAADGNILVGGTAPNTAVGNVLGATDGITVSNGTGLIAIQGVGTVTGTTGTGITATFGSGSVTIGGIGAVSGGTIGIDASGGTGGITLGGTTTAGQIPTVTGGTTGINVSTTSAAQVLIAGIGGITGGNGAGQFGIDVAVAGSPGVVIGANGVSAAGLVGNISGGTGINVSLSAGGGGGIITIAGVGNVTGAAGPAIALSAADGNILVGGTAPNTAVGNVLGATDGITVSNGTGLIAIQGVGTVTGTTGTGITATFGSGSVTIGGTGAVSGGTIGIDASGGTGGITLGGTTTAGQIPTVTGGATGINVSTTSAAQVLIAGIGGISGGNAAGQFGIDVAVAGSPGVVIGANGVSAVGLVGNISGGTGINVSLTSGGGFGPITVAGVGNVTGATGAGIALDAGAGGSITVGGSAANTAVGNVQGATSGITANAGTVSVTATQNVTGLAGSGIAASGPTSITIAIDGGITRGATNAIAATSAASIQVTNNATIMNLSGLASDQVVATSSNGSATIVNAGVMTGTVAMAGTGTQTVTNNATWTTLGTSTFTANSTVDNGGSIVVSNVATFSGLANLNNTGTIQLTNVTSRLVTSGNISFAPGSSLSLQISPTSTGTMTVGGSATLAGNGTVIVTPQIGHYGTTVFRIVTTTGGVSGPFAGLTINGSFAGTMSLDYTTDPGDVDLDISNNGAGLFVLPPGANQNQQNVFNGINNAIMSGATLPPGFANLANLNGPSFLEALTLLSGESATGAQKSAFQAMNDFLALIFDYSLTGRGGGTGGAMAFAPEGEANLPPDVALAYASVLKAPPRAPLPFLGGWSAWGSGFGGYSAARGDPVAGSTSMTARDFGFAAGMDYRPDTDTLYGFALAGAGTNWGLADGLGGGRSDAFQAAVYGRRQIGQGYVSGALAFADHWFVTNRTGLGGDQLSATFSGQSYAARIESGFRYAMPLAGTSSTMAIGITPYAALQTQLFHTPAYSEADATGGGFGLSYGAMDAIDTRSELGARFDNLQMIGDMPLLLRGRLAWAHDWADNPALTAAFQALPGSAFTVNGAPLPKDSALASASAELRMNASWSAGLKFDGEFASGAHTYAGTGTLRYAW